MIRITDFDWKSPGTITFDVVWESNFMFGSHGSEVIVEKLGGFWVPTGVERSGDWSS